MTVNEKETLFQRVILRWGQHEGRWSQATELQAGKVKLDINYNVNQDLGSDLLFPKSMQHYWFMACITFICRIDRLMVEGVTASTPAGCSQVWTSTFWLSLYPFNDRTCVVEGTLWQMTIYKLSFCHVNEPLTHTQTHARAHKCRVFHINERVKGLHLHPVLIMSDKPKVNEGEEATCMARI